MTVENIIRIIAGIFIMLSLALGYWVSEYFYLFTAFVGLNLFQSGITKWCLMEDILKATVFNEKNNLFIYRDRRKKCLEKN
jgi:hypothetical protein